MADPQDAYLSAPVQRAARLLRHVADGNPAANMAHAARELGINRTTLLRLLHTLEAERLIEPRGAGMPGWRIGMGLVGMAAQAFFAMDLVQAAIPVLARLAESLSLSAHLGVLDGRDIVHVVQRTPNHSLVSNVHVGSRLPAHAASMGRIVLAHLAAGKLARLYADAPLPPQVRAGLDQDRAAGLSWSEGRNDTSISSVAAAVLDASGAPVAALDVSGQAMAFEGTERRAQVARAVTAAAEEISRHLGWPGASRRRGGRVGLKVVA